MLKGDSKTGWRGVDKSRSLGGKTDVFLDAYEEMFVISIRNIEAILETGDFREAQARIEKLERRSARHSRLRQLREAIRYVESAKKLSRLGKFSEAQAKLNEAFCVHAESEVIRQMQKQCSASLEKSHELTRTLYSALHAEDWNQVAALAEQLLKMSPENMVARDARRRAWSQVGTPSGVSRVLSGTHVWVGDRTTMEINASLRGVAVNPSKSKKRFNLWLDAVGGYLVCPSEIVMLGQATAASQIAVPILADISRRHAKICRKGDGYLIEPLARVAIEDQEIQEVTLLTDGDLVELGKSVRFRFRQPHPLSATARLEFLSGHRTQPSADAVILMAESCVLGPHWRNHVVCRDWPGDLVLFWQDGELHCRSDEPFEVDGKMSDGLSRLQPNSRVSTDCFSMSLEGV